MVKRLPIQNACFWRNAIIVALLYSGFISSDIQTFYTHTQKQLYIFPVQGLRFFFFVVFFYKMQELGPPTI